MLSILLDAFTVVKYPALWRKPMIIMAILTIVFAVADFLLESVTYYLWVSTLVIAALIIPFHVYRHFMLERRRFKKRNHRLLLKDKQNPAP